MWELIGHQLCATSSAFAISRTFRFTPLLYCITDVRLMTFKSAIFAKIRAFPNFWLIHFCARFANACFIARSPTSRIKFAAWGEERFPFLKVFFDVLRDGVIAKCSLVTRFLCTCFGRE
jgi:hypothetical protein